MDICLRVLKESNKSRCDSYRVRNSVLIISHITFRDCRVHIFSDNLSRNSCMHCYVVLLCEVYCVTVLRLEIIVVFLRYNSRLVIHLVYGAPARLGLYLYKYRWWRILRKLTKSSVLFHNIFKDFFLGPVITVELISYSMKLPHGFRTHGTIITLQCYGIH